MNDLRICEDEAEVIRLMFEKAKREGLGPLRIANYLNEHGYTQRKALESVYRLPHPVQPFIFGNSAKRWCGIPTASGASDCGQ